MNTYNDTNLLGQLWMRDINNNVIEATNALSAVYLKYQTIQPLFFSELTSNNITKFDIFYDTLFIQTNSGYVFEKIKYDTSGILPYSEFNHYIQNQSNNIDYWFNEKNKKIYFYGFYTLENSTSNFTLSTYFNVFDINTGNYKNLYNPVINFGSITNSNPISMVEDPKMTFNIDTNTFNISFIVRNYNNTFGLVSINFNENEILEINSFLPYPELDRSSAFVTF
jgi:hypothetical protein